MMVCGDNEFVDLTLSVIVMTTCGRCCGERPDSICSAYGHRARNNRPALNNRPFHSLLHDITTTTAGMRGTTLSRLCETHTHTHSLPFFSCLQACVCQGVRVQIANCSDQNVAWSYISTAIINLNWMPRDTGWRPARARKLSA